MRTNVLLLGLIASGKTYSLRTLTKINKTVLVLALEPGVADSLSGCGCNENLHITTITPASVDWDDLEDLATKVSNANGGDAMTKIIDPNKRSYTQFLQVYSKLRKFTCDYCNHDFGPVDKLDDSYAVVIDGLTGLSKMAMHMTVGLKPHRSWPEYDAGGQQVENLLMKCCGDLKASFILLAHVDREPDPVGGTRLTMHTIGNKLAPRLEKDLFSEIIVAKREDSSRGPKFYWSTVETNYALKARRLPFLDNIEPNFALILGEG